MARLIYSVIFYLLVPFIFIRLILRGFKSPLYFQRWGERFGCLPDVLEFDRPLWVHAVSVGEFIAATPVIKRIQRKHPGLQIVVTTMTPTGSERVRAALNDQVLHFYMPYDLPHVMAKVVSKVNPCALVIMETEIWPNLVHYSHKSGVPILLANARMSERSAKGYSRFPNLIGQTLDKLTLVGAQNPADAERLIDLGVEPKKTRVMGNVKFDLNIPASLREQALAMRHQWGINRPVWIAASTHDGEDEAILCVHRQVLKQIPDALLIVVPRHPERFEKVATAITKEGFKMRRRTDTIDCTGEIEVFLGNTMGELMLFFSTSDVAFIGGSLIASGGHNLLEPAALGVPTFFGPHMFNFSEVSRLILEAKGGKQIADAKALEGGIIEFLSDSSLRAEYGERSMQVVEKNKGAIEILVQEVDKYLDLR